MIPKYEKWDFYFVIYSFITGNALGMVGVSTGIAATLGILAPSQESFAQMAACMGTGNKSINYEQRHEISNNFTF